MTKPKCEDMWDIMREYTFEMGDNILKGLICTICKKVMIKACSSHCECRYCFECITKYLEKGDQFCPGEMAECRDEMINIDEDIHIDVAINCRISKLVVKCPLESCNHKEELGKMGNHWRDSHAPPINCLYHNIGCRETNSPGDRMKEHLAMENYAHTKYLVEWIDNVTNEMGSLRKYIGGLQGEINNLQDKNRQNQMTNRSMTNEINNLKENDLQNKLEIVKLQTNTNTKNDHIKLLNEISEQKKENRLLKEEINHLKMEIEEVRTNVKINEELLNKEMVALKNENRSMKEHINNLQSQDKKTQMEIDELRTNANELSRQIDLWKERCDYSNYEKHEQLIEGIGKLNQRNDELAERSDQFIKNIESKTETLDRKLIEMETNVAKQNHGEFVWIIENISEKIKQAKEEITVCIFSEPFYSHKNGYKLCLQMFPDGNGSDKGEYLSVYFCMMKGSFDDVVSWPFKHDVTFSLMNQQSGLVHVAKTIKYIDHPSSNKYFTRPTNQRNVGFGNCQFIELAQLLSNGALIQDDKIIFKSTVTIP